VVIDAPRGQSYAQADRDRHPPRLIPAEEAAAASRASPALSDLPVSEMVTTIARLAAARAGNPGAAARASLPPPRRRRARLGPAPGDPAVTPAEMAALHADAMTFPRPWSETEFAALLALPGTFVTGDPAASRWAASFSTRPSF
jgi:hypothetical protein